MGQITGEENTDVKCYFQSEQNTVFKSLQPCLTILVLYVGLTFANEH